MMFLGGRSRLLLAGTRQRRSSWRCEFAWQQNYLSTGSSNTQVEETGTDEPWKTLLELIARASWRVTDTAPLALSQALDHVLSSTATKTKKKHLSRIQDEDVIAIQQDLARRRERERQRVVRNQPSPLDPKKIWPVLYGREQVLTSFYFRLVPNFAVTKRVLEETKSLLGGQTAWKPRRILDFGMGCGSATAACLDVLDEHDIEWIHGIDASQTMREGAQTFLEEYLRQMNRTTRLTFSSYLSSSSSNSEGAFDVALFVYTATELPYSTSTLAAAALMWEKLAPGGIFVMIEPGTPDGFASVRTVRNLLLASNHDDQDVQGQEYCQILAPCTHQGPCPMERFPQKQQNTTRNEPHVTDGDSNQDDGYSEESEEVERVTKKGFCSFVQSMPAREGRAKTEKFSYLVAQKRIRGQEEEPFPFAKHRLTDILAKTQQSAQDMDIETYKEQEQAALELQQRYLDSTDDHLGLELLRGDENRSSFGRIIHAPRKRKGHVLLECCAAPGRIARYKIAKSLSKRVPGIYSAARKSRWGGFWPEVKAFEG